MEKGKKKMERRLKIGILTFHYYINYGSALQSYALQESIRNLGYQVELINYIQVDGKARQLLGKIKNKSLDMFCACWWKVNGNINFYNLKSNIRKDFESRKRCFQSFFSQYYKLSPEVFSRGELQAISRRYTDVLCGSDQILNFRHSHYHMEYLLNFLDDNINKISYAASIGVKKVPVFWKWIYRKFLMNFKAISVRETTAVNIVQRVTGKKIELVLDPTMLLSREQWERLVKGIKIDEEYIFCYFLGHDKTNIQYVEYLGKVLKLPIVIIKHLVPHCSNAYEKLGDIVLNEVSPNEFLGLIENAKYVCTDSFHGSVFSILFQKNFLSFNRYNNRSRKSENVRIDSLLTLLNIDRLVTRKEDLNKIKKEIDYDLIQRKLDKEKKKSIEFLRSNLESGKASC